MKKKELLKEFSDLLGGKFYGNVSMLFRRMNMKQLRAIHRIVKELDKIPLSDLGLTMSILLIRIENHYELNLSPVIKRKIRSVTRIKS